MSELIEVTPSGAVGKQVFDADHPTIVTQVILTAPTSAASIQLRDGNASGEVKLTVHTLVGDTNTVNLGEDQKGKRFDKGLHVEVLGVGALGYLEIV